jgi:hypothetical protein
MVFITKDLDKRKGIKNWLSKDGIEMVFITKDLDIKNGIKK